MNSEDTTSETVDSPVPVAIPEHLSDLDKKILLNFPGLVVRKDLTKGLKQNAVVRLMFWSICWASIARQTTLK
jgi:hypothetical protein